MRSRRRTQAVVLFFLASLCVLLVMACTPAVKDARHQAPPFLLSNPTTVSAGPVSLAVGTQHWSNPASGLEEVFFPVAVTVRNGGNQPFSSPFHSPVFPFTPGSQGAPIGGVPGGGGLSGGRARPRHWGPSPRAFAPQPFSSPFYSPFSPFAPSPFYSPFYNPFPPPYP